nr:MAG TPA: hypothetical protein [Caudoviricetes sp.]DAS81327.1 MAG TPA: hypothetical protein [Caudoviricetes sp.]DAT41058.1 MAG TPA: hypothetical protein [Caudoviricetes sp.]
MFTGSDHQSALSYCLYHRLNHSNFFFKSIS